MTNDVDNRNTKQIAQIADALLSAFEWDDSKEGYEYWNDVHQKLLRMIEQAETTDDLFLENHRYLEAAFFVLPLPSGRIAILTPRRDHFATVDSWEEAMRIGPSAGFARAASFSLEKSSVKLNLTEIGL